MVKQTIPMKMY